MDKNFIEIECIDDGYKCIRICDIKEFYESYNLGNRLCYRISIEGYPLNLDITKESYEFLKKELVRTNKEEYTLIQAKKGLHKYLLK